MGGKLYLRSYYSGVMKDVYSINIARGNMNGIGDKRICLAPSKELFDWFQKNKNMVNWFDDYKKVYMNQLKNNKLALNELSDIKSKLDKGEDVCLYCFCRDFNKCHRLLIGNLFINKGYEVICE